MKRGLMAVLILVLLTEPSAFAKNRVYTNKDLERYGSKPAVPVITYKASKISVNFLDADLYQVLLMIAEEAKKRDSIEIFVSPEISGKITIKKLNAPWTEILKEIGRMHNLAEIFLGKSAMLITGKDKAMAPVPAATAPPPQTTAPVPAEPAPTPPAPAK